MENKNSSASKISVVMPMYNEEAVIAGNIKEVVKTLEGLGNKWELILVNDGSRDNTLSIIQELAKNNHNIRIISYLMNRGRGYALKTGFKAASGDYIIATESDLTWGTKIISRFVLELDKGDADIIIASPHMDGGRMENVPLLRRLISYLGNKIFSIALPGKFTMCTGMTRAYKKEVLDVLDLEADDKELHVEILYKAMDLGFCVREIPAILRWKKPEEGVKVRRSKFKMRHILAHLLLSFSVQPFILFGTLGLFSMGLGVISGIYLLGLSVSGIAVRGRPLLFVSVLLIVIGFQILFFGFLAHQNRELKRQLSRIQRDIRKK